ncbi:hypothetical protein O3P69_009202 [Scylla paramamosain]|uniref:Uncharacterized protein n=1 Tax=Scylla paramamosain TaxID=85552 RepID=A0AAW0TC58_SCYPA
MTPSAPRPCHSSWTTPPPPPSVSACPAYPPVCLSVCLLEGRRQASRCLSAHVRQVSGLPSHAQTCSAIPRPPQPYPDILSHTQTYSNPRPVSLAPPPSTSRGACSVTAVHQQADKYNVSNVVRSQPAVPSRPLQSTSGQRGNPAQDVDPVYYGILPDFSSRRVVVPRPARHSEELVYDDVLPELGVRPRLPIYENVPPPGGSASPHGHLEAPAVRESQLYASVL